MSKELIIYCFFNFFININLNTMFKNLIRLKKLRPNEILDNSD